MKQLKWSGLVVVLVLSSLSLEACSFSVETLPAAPPAEIPSTSISSAIAVKQTSAAPAVMPRTATPTLISIRADTIPMLEVVKSFALGEIVHSLAFTPDGTVLAAAGGNTQDFAIRLWDVPNEKSLGTLDSHTGIVWGLAFSPDGQMLASVSSDATAKIWDWRHATLLKSLDFPGEVASVSFSPDGHELAVGGVDELQNQIQNAAIWTFSAGSWEPLVKFPEYWNITAMAYSPGGNILVGGGNSRNVQVWKASDGTPVFTLNHAHQVGKAAISPDGSTVVTATCERVVNYECMDGGVWLWDLSTGKLLRKLTGFPAMVMDVAFSVDGSTLIAASRDGLLRFYDTADYRTLFEFISSDGVSTLSISPDGGWLAIGGLNGEVNIWKNVYHP